jgi:hypothetical protein
MRRILNPEIALGFFVASLFWIGVVGLQASYAPTEKQKDECYEAARKTGYKADECKSFWERTTGDPIALFNLILAFSTVGLWVATISLYRAGRQQFDLARQEFIATHRPRIILRYIQGPFYNDEGHQFIWLTFVNTGANDATIEAFGGDLAYRGGFNETWEIPGLDAELKDIEPITIVCGQRHVFEVTAKTSSSSDEAISKSAWQGRQICAVGRIRYRDANGISRDTGFFRVLDDEGVNFVVSKHDSEMEYQD